MVANKTCTEISGMGGVLVGDGILLTWFVVIWTVIILYYILIMYFAYIFINKKFPRSFN